MKQQLPKSLTNKITRSLSLPYWSFIIESWNKSLVLSLLLISFFAASEAQTTPMTDSQIVDSDYVWLTDSKVLSQNTSLSNVQTQLNLPKNGINGSQISWRSDVSSVVDLNTGALSRDNFTDKSLTLTASITKGAISRTKTFAIIVKQNLFSEQVGDNPILFDPIVAKSKDNIVYLMAAASRHSSNLTIFNAGAPKHFWINNFATNANDYLQWTVNVSTAGLYNVNALISASTSQRFKLYVAESLDYLNFTPSVTGWDKINAGTILLPAGTSTLRLLNSSTNYSAVLIKSLELVRASDYPNYLNRISQFKANTKTFSTSKYGLMFQYGVWGFPKSGAAKTMEAATNDFNVPAFVDMVKSTGAKYIIWSLTWYQYRMQAPIHSVDSIMGAKTLTTTRDLIAEISTALKAQGIGFYLYYHSGLNQEPTWLAKQNWPANNIFTLFGTGDRTVFFNNWKSVIKEIGARYGSNLDGWFFDDGCNYYPAPFETLAEVARTANANRLVSWNSWVACRFTDFEDVYMGEGSHGEVTTGSAPVGGDGVFVSGPHKGKLQQSMFTTEQDWGVHAINTAINSSITSANAINYVTSASTRNVPLSFDMMMWEDGSVSDATLNVLKAVKTRFYPMSAAINVQIDKNMSFNPTIVTENATLKIADNVVGPCQLSVVDLMGKTVYSRSLTHNEQSVVLDFSSLSPGVYLFRLMGGELFECKFLKK